MKKTDLEEFNTMISLIQLSDQKGFKTCTIDKRLSFATRKALRLFNFKLNFTKNSTIISWKGK